MGPLKKAKKAKIVKKASTSFKTKKIVIRKQLKCHDATEILSTRKLNIKDLLIRLRHHNLTMRKDALGELKQIFSKYSPKSLHSELGSLLRGIAALSLDKERIVRRDSLVALHLILGPTPQEELIPYLDVLISYLSCAMTHIDPNIKEDSLRFLDVLLQYCGNMLAANSHKILPKFLGMICKMHSDNKCNRQLTTIPNFKSTNIMWRIKVLERLANMLKYITSNEEVNKTMCSNTLPQKVKCYTKFLPIYSGTSVTICKVNFNENTNSESIARGTLPMEELIKYTNTLMPLMCDIWLEVCPNEKLENHTEITISNETYILLKSIINIIQSIIKYVDALDFNNNDLKHTKHLFMHKFSILYMNNFLLKFPYSKVRDFTGRPKKCQEDYTEMELNERCLEENLALCQIHIWFTSVDSQKKFTPSTKNCCLSVLKYVNDTIENGHINDKLALSQLTKLLRTLFLSASITWHKNDINPSQTLQLLIKATSRVSKFELQSDLFLIIGNIILECDLKELHREEAFKKYIATLPDLLLKPSINEATICMINQIALRFRQWIRKKLVIRHQAIMENVKNIEIIGTQDVKKSRLMICNLFYFMDAEIYY